MGNVNTLLDQRLKKGDHSSKIAALARQSAEGNLTSFGGMFQVIDLSNGEKEHLQSILEEHADTKNGIENDLKALISITCEVKAINNQAALLHGERIKKAQRLLIPYKDGAFTAWLMATYGNRQTPYNFLQYYEFYEAMPKNLRPKIETMPRQAIYTLASREGEVSKKLEIVENYQGETKEQLLQIIRDFFPLSLKDRRQQNSAEGALQALTKAFSLLAKPKFKISHEEKERLEKLITHIQSLLSSSKTY